MANKLIKNLNHEVWTNFVCWCKLKKVRTGDKLSEILKEHLKNNKTGEK